MITIRNMNQTDTAQIMDMMRVFYASPAVLTNGSDEIFRTDIEACLGNNPYLEGFVFTEGDDILGYAMLAKSFSTEYGLPCIWIEDIYIKHEHRGKGIGKHFFAELERRYPHAVLKLEVEPENLGAMRMYERCGYQTVHYTEMKKILTSPEKE